MRSTKQVIVVRRDLKMRRGKEIAQGSHASIAFLTRPMQERAGPVMMGEILQDVAFHFDITEEEMCSPSRESRVLIPRQVAMTLAKEFTSFSYKGIGRFFGPRDHATVIHAKKKMGNIQDPHIRESMDILREGLRNRRMGSAHSTPRLSRVQRQWIKSGFTKVCVRVDSEEELLEVHERAKEAELTCHLIKDSGKTEFDGVPTLTCLAVGPDWSDEIDKVTGGLKLY